MYIEIKNCFFSQQIREILAILSQTQTPQDPRWPLYNHPVLVLLCYLPDQDDPTERAAW